MAPKKKTAAQLDAEIAQALSGSHAKPDTYEVEIESSPGIGFRTLASYPTYAEAKRHARSEIDNDRYAVRVVHTEHLAPHEVKRRVYTFRDADYVDEDPERL
ncbi:MAG TPA: hypothetical protein VLE97_11215 [Gaiellaceae bacterium]|nr:hypothetical protein [Gaiellaceae bacterium]